MKNIETSFLTILLLANLVLSSCTEPETAVQKSDSTDGTAQDTATDSTTAAGDSDSGGTGRETDSDTGFNTSNDTAGTSHPGTSDTQTVDTETNDSADTTTHSGTDSISDGDTGSDEDTDPTDPCPGGVMCGSPATCCGPGNECISGACLPECPSNVRCGEDLLLCCEAAEVCLSGACTAPTGDCKDSYDCVPGEFCEPTMEKCLEHPEGDACEIVPQFDSLAISEEWSVIDDPIISIPVVANLDADGAPEVVVNLTYQDGGSWTSGTIAVLDGATGFELNRIPHDPGNGSYGSHGRTSIAVGDVSGDGLPDIVYAARPREDQLSLIVATDRTGELLWIARDADDTPKYFAVVNGAATLANFDDDSAAEVVFGATLIDNDGRVLWDAGNGAAYGTNANYVGGISAVADLDGDKAPEIISGKHAWKVVMGTGNAGQTTAEVSAFWPENALSDGYPAVADMDGNGTPEVILVGGSQVSVLDGAAGKLMCGVDPTCAACDADPSARTQPLPIPGGAGNNRGGPPTVADFDGDGRPEIGVAGGYAYSVYDLHRPGEDIAVPEGDPTPELGALFVKWTQTTQDLTSNATGSSVFDFQGDGAAEVVYADECYLRVYSGTDGSLQLETPNKSSTIHEYPLVVDVDADGNSEILVVANENDAINCPHGQSNKGLYVYGDKNDEWVPTRKVWPQHTYHVTNSDAVGNVPMNETDNWTLEGLNNYRQNSQGAGVFNAPDLAVDLSVAYNECVFGGDLRLLARVTNQGSLGVHPGVEVSFYAGEISQAALIATEVTTGPLLPGASTTIEVKTDPPISAQTYFAIVDGGAAGGAVAECNEDNNDSAIADIFCPRIN